MRRHTCRNASELPTATTEAGFAGGSEPAERIVNRLASVLLAAAVLLVGCQTAAQMAS